MSFIDKWIQKKVDKRVEEFKAVLFQPGVRYAIQNGKIVSPVDNKQTYITEGYNKNDIIYSVINIILDKVRLPEWSLYKVVDESSLKKANKILSRKNITAKEYKEAVVLKYQSIEPLSSYNLQAGKLNSLLEYANESCTFQDFITYGSLYKLLTGDVFLWGELLSGGANAGIPNSLWVLPSQFMTIRATDEFPLRDASYELTVFNQKFDKESILHELYSNPNWSVAGEQLYGFAPLRAFLKNITRNNAAKDTSAAKFQNGGLDDIIYFDEARFSDPALGMQQANLLKIKLAEEYSGPTNVGKHAISPYKVGVAPVGSTPVELGIIDSEKWDAIMFCNGYGVPPEMLGLVAKTYNNVVEAEKALTTRSAIPLLDSRRNSLNRKIQTDWGFRGVNIYIDYETECFPELQADITETMNAISKVTMATPNEEREAANMEALTEPEADEIWVMQNGSRVPLSDFQANLVDQQLINDAINNGTNGQGNSANGNGKVPANANGKAGLSNGNGKVKIFERSV